MAYDVSMVPAGHLNYQPPIELERKYWAIYSNFVEVILQFHGGKSLPKRKQLLQAFVIHHTTCQLKKKLEGLQNGNLNKEVKNVNFT